MDREQYFHKILIFFAVVTAITGIFNMANAGTITLGNLGTGTIPGQVIAGTSTTGYVEGANTAAGIQVIGTNFTAIPAINPNITDMRGGPWTLSGAGMTLTGLPLIHDPSSPLYTPSVVLVRNAQSTGLIYSTTCKIKNPTNADFYVTPRFITGFSGSDIFVRFSNDGVHLKKLPLDFGFIDAGDDYFYPLPDSQVTLSEGSLIKTVLTETVSAQNSNIPDYTSQLTVSKDGIQLFTILTRSILPGTSFNDFVFHGGAGSDSIGFIVMGFEDTRALDVSGVIYSGSGGSVLNPIDAAQSFIGLIAQILGLTSSALVPFWVWAIISIPCIATLLFMFVEMIRGN